MPARVGAYHSLTARRAHFPRDALAITAETAEGVVMAIGHRRLPAMAVQFHPESILSMGPAEGGEIGHRLIENAVAAAGARSGAAGGGGVRPIIRPKTSNLSILSNIAILDKEDAMLRISATEAKQRLAAVLDAAQREPVVIRRQNRDVAVVLSMEDYERMRGANVAEFQRYSDEIARRAAARGLSEDKLAEILTDDA